MTLITQEVKPRELDLIHDLTLVELHLLKHMSTGLSTPKLAEQLGVTTRTITNKLSLVRDKLEVDTNVSAAILYWKLQACIEPTEFLKRQSLKLYQHLALHLEVNEHQTFSLYRLSKVIGRSRPQALTILERLDAYAFIRLSEKKKNTVAVMRKM